MSFRYGYKLAKLARDHYREPKGVAENSAIQAAVADDMAKHYEEVELKDKWRKFTASMVRREAWLRKKEGGLESNL